MSCNRSPSRLKLAWRFIETKEQEKEREKLERDRRKAEAAGEEWVEPKKENPFAARSGEVNPENHLTMDFDYPLTKLDSAAMLLTLTHPDNSIEDIPGVFGARYGAAAPLSYPCALENRRAIYPHHP